MTWLRRSAGWAIALGLAFGGAGTTAIGHAQEAVTAESDEDGRLHFEIGSRHYARGEFLEAAREFERAYDASGRPALLYNVYIAYRDADEPRGAARALRDYLGAIEDDSALQESRAVLEQRLSVLEGRVAALEEADIADVEVRDPDSDTEPVPPPQEIPAPGGVPLGPVILTSVGGAALIGGVITGVMALGVDSDLESACVEMRCSPEEQSDIDRGKTLALTTDILLFGGAAIAVGGVLWWLLAPSDDDASASRADQVTAMCNGEACMVGYGREF